MDKREQIVDALDGFKIIQVQKDYGSNGDYLGIAIKIIYKNKNILIRYDLLQQDVISMEGNTGELIHDEKLEDFILDWVEEHIEFRCKVSYDEKEIREIY